MSETVGGIYRGVGDQISNFLEFFSIFLEVQRLSQRLYEMDQSDGATSADRYNSAIAAAIAHLSPVAATASPALAAAIARLSPLMGARAGRYRALPPGGGSTARASPLAPSLAPLSPA